MLIRKKTNNLASTSLALFISFSTVAAANEDSEDQNNLSRNLGLAASAAGSGDIGIGLGLAASATAGLDVGDRLSEGDFGGATGSYAGTRLKAKLVEELLPKCVKRARSVYTLAAYPAACFAGINYAVEKGLVDPSGEFVNAALGDHFSSKPKNLAVASPLNDEQPHNWPRENTSLENEDRFLNSTPAGFSDPNSADENRPSRIPYQSGQGIKCGPISASERRQLEESSYYQGMKKSLKRAEYAYENTPERSRGAGVSNVNGRWVSMKEGHKHRAAELRGKLKRELVKLRNSNGYCPAPIEESPSSPLQSGSQASNAQPVANPQQDTGNSSGNDGLPPGYSQIRPGACRSSAGDVFRC